MADDRLINAWTALAILLLVVAGAGADDCPLTPDVTLPAGQHEVGVTVLWPHEDPANLGHRYTFTTIDIFYGPGALPLSYEGHPIRAIWVINGLTFTVDCPLFADDFETGTTGGWSATHGGHND
jgi:hypothetical protein